MKKVVIAIFAALAALSVVSCDVSLNDPKPITPTRKYLLNIENRSDHDVVWYVPAHGAFPCELAGALPGVLTETEREKEFHRLAAHSYVDVVITEDSYKSNIETYHPKDRVNFYFFDAKVLDSESWEDIVAGEKWLAKYSYSADDVILMNKKIRYPESI